MERKNRIKYNEKYWKNMKYDKDYKECVGCFEYKTIKTKLYCIFITYNIQDKCPCRLCLIKGMCQVACEDYNKFVEYFNSLKLVKVKQTSIM